jgi:hypothetical protein
MYLANLGAFLVSRFERAGNPSDLDTAIEASQRAVDFTPSGHAQLAMYMSNLGAAHHARFVLAGELADLDAAIRIGKHAIDRTSPGDPNLTMSWWNLGNSHFARFERAANPADLTSAIRCWQHASQLTTGRPSFRLAAARRWGAAAAAGGRLHEAAEGYQVAVGLLPIVAWHGLDRTTREEQLEQAAGLVAEAVACAVLNGSADRAVELLEQGRLVLWTQALNLRSDLEHLAAKHRGLAERLDGIRKILDTPLPLATMSAPGSPGARTAADQKRRRQDAIDLRRRKAREWDETLAEVRREKGFERFLAAIPYADLRAATSGPVVIVNANDHGSHALIVTAGGEHAQNLDLPQLTAEAVGSHASAFLQALGGLGPAGGFADFQAQGNAIFDVLAWLWDAVAEPVLLALGHAAMPTDNDAWPRVWWCPIGPLAVLPIHAAGRYPRGSASGTIDDSVLERVVSSYTPSLTTLARAQRLGLPDEVRQLSVGMPTTPGLARLPAVPGELAVLYRRFPPEHGHQQLAGPQAVRADVLAAINTHSWLHIACHAAQNDIDPSLSGFALWDGTLTVADLASSPAGHRGLAFLSACETATGSVRHLDEAIHLAAAMQFLGYQHVIATMWTIADRPTADLAENVYATLTHGGTSDDSRAAYALHHAVRNLRQKYPAMPQIWAPYIHIGP